MKKIFLLLLSVLMIVSLASCGNKCEHTYDNACDAICNDCEESREITHTWVDADCDTPKTCSVCGATEGEALGHDWSDKNGTCKNDNTHTCDHGGATSGTCSTCGKDLGGTGGSTGGSDDNPTSHTHSGTLVPGQAATEEAAGWKDYYKCSCGTYYEDAACTVEIGNAEALEEWKTTKEKGLIPQKGYTVEDWNNETLTGGEAEEQSN